MGLPWLPQPCPVKLGTEATGIWGERHSRLPGLSWSDAAGTHLSLPPHFTGCYSRVKRHEELWLGGLAGVTAQSQASMGEQPLCPWGGSEMTPKTPISSKILSPRCPPWRLWVPF